MHHHLILPFALMLAASLGAQTVLATHSLYGTGCGTECPDSFVQAFATPASFDLANTAAFTMFPTGGGYLAVPGVTTFVPPTGAATALPLADDDEVTVTMTSPFPADCDGLTTQLTICSNGFISLGTGNGTGFTPDMVQMLTAPQTAFWCWHDYDPAAMLGGRVKYEEIGPVAYVTWDGVDDYVGSGVSTFQFQFDLATGQVHLVCLSMSTAGTGYVVGYSRGGAPLGACELDLSALVTKQLCCMSSGITPLHLDMLDEPIVGTTPRFLTSNIPPRTWFVVVTYGLTSLSLDLTPWMPGCWLLQDLVLPFGPFVIAPPSSVQTTYFLLAPVPNLLGVVVYAQSLAWVGGLQTAVTSNGVEMVIGDY